MFFLSSRELGFLIGIVLCIWSGSALSAGTKQWTTGNDKFGAYANAAYDFKVTHQTKDSKASVSADLGAKLFGKTRSVARGDLLIGNYGSYNISPPSVDLNAANNWQVRAVVDVFGKTVWSKTKDVQSTSEMSDVTGSNNYVMEDFYSAPIPIGPISISIRSGVSADLKQKPTFSINGLTSLSATYIPQASALAFIEGSANLLVARGGAGASLTMLEGTAGPKLDFSVENENAQLYGVAAIELLKGRMFAFVDRISIKCCFKKKWKRVFDATLVNWNGIRYDRNELVWSYPSSQSAGYEGASVAPEVVQEVAYDTSEDTGSDQTTACSMETGVFTTFAQSDGAGACTGTPTGIRSWGEYVPIFM